MAFKEAQILFTGALVVEVLYDKTCDYLHKLDFSDKTTSAHITFSSCLSILASLLHVLLTKCHVPCVLFPENGKRRSSLIATKSVR